MPTYEYLCSACGHEFEIFQRMSDKALKKCPSCSKQKLDKVLSGGAGLVFKGSGFYETDYKRGKDSDYQTKSSGDKSSNLCPAAKEGACTGACSTAD